MIKKIESEKQKIIITGLITSDEYCRHISPILDYNKSLTNNIFSNYYKITLNWCLDFYKRYNKSPKKNIQKIYEESYNKGEFEEQDYELIGDFLSKLSNGYEREKNFNEQYVIDQSLLYLRKVNLNVLKKQISSIQDVAQAEKFVEDFRHIKKETSDLESFDVFNNIDYEIEETFNEEKDILFKLPGRLGEYLYYFQRGDLISYTAPAGRGKTWALQETAIIALLNQLRVAYFSFEMNKKQCKKRLYQTLVGEVNRLPKGQKNIEIQLPVFKYDEDMEKYIIEYEKRIKYGLQKEKIKKKLNALKIQVRGGGLRIYCPSAYSMNTNQIANLLDEEILNGFIPDVIILDYADIIQPEQKSEYRHQIDSIWKGLKKLAQKKHCVVFTASHSNKKTFEKDIGESDVVEDSRKLNHVSIMIALNQKAEEKKLGIMRASILKHRHEEFNKINNFIILQNLKIGKFLLDSKLESEVDHHFNYKKPK